MAAERARVQEMEQRVTEIGAQLGSQAQGIEEMVRKVDAIERTQTQMSVDMTTYTRGMETQKAEFVIQVNDEFDKHRVALQVVVDAARDEFQKLSANMTELYSKTAEAFAQVVKKVSDLEQATADKSSSGGNAGTGAFRGYLPAKSMIPGKFGSAEEGWRKWQDDVCDYMDAITPGMRKLLKAVELETGAVDDAWIANKLAEGKYSTKALTDGVSVYRLLKVLTEGEAHMVVQGVPEESGYNAWKQLHLRYGLSVAAKQGKAMADVGNMVTKPAKNPAETRTLISELERRVRLAEDITGRTLDDNHKKSVLAGVLDPTTKLHTSMHMGVSTSYHELKRVVLEFANNVSVRADPDAMVIGRVEEDSPDNEGPAHSCQWEAELEHIAAVSATTQCYKCHGYGHVASQCATPKGKGKGGKPMHESGYGKVTGKGWPEQNKGKGKQSFGKGGLSMGKASGKGKAAPKFGGCWICGKAHYAADCPENAKGKGGFSSLGEHWPSLPGSDIRTLSAVRIVKETPSKNRFDALKAHNEELEEQEKSCGTRGQVQPTLGDFITVRPRRAHHKHRPSQQQPTGRGKLCPLATIEPETLNPVEKLPEWEVIELAVDSGASETVIPEDLIKSVQTKPSSASLRGVMYEVANGERIPNMGEKTFQALTDGEGFVRGITAQVCDVNKPLLSVSKLVQSGNTVVFDSDGAYVEDKGTGERMWLKESGGMYMMKLWVPSAGF